MTINDSREEAIEDALDENEDLNWSIVLLRMEITERGERIKELSVQNELLKKEVVRLRKKDPETQVAAILKAPEND